MATSWLVRATELLKDEIPAPYWRPAEELPGYDRLLAAYSGRTDLAAYAATSNLVIDVADAATAVRHYVGRLATIIETEMDDSDRFIARSSGPGPGLGRVLSSPGLTRAHWEYGTILAWTRAFIDRVSREEAPLDGRVTKYLATGLIPALNPSHPATAEVRALWDEAKSRNVLKDAEMQANFGLHVAGADPSYPARIGDDGRVQIAIPDPVLRRILGRDQLTYTARRDAASFSLEIAEAIASFVDGLLNVLEGAGRARG